MARGILPSFQMRQEVEATRPYHMVITEMSLFLKPTLSFQFLYLGVFHSSKQLPVSTVVSILFCYVSISIFTLLMEKSHET